MRKDNVSMDDDYRRIQEEAEDYRRKQYAKQIEADMKKERDEKIKKYATYAGSVVMIFVIAILVMQMGGGAFFAELFGGTKNDMSAPVPEEKKTQSAEGFVLADILDAESYAAGEKWQATEQEFETTPETELETASEAKSETEPETASEAESEAKPVAKPKKIEGTDLYEENPDGQTEITDIAVVKAEALYLKDDGSAWYLIKKGDTLSALATRFDLTVESIAKENGIRNVNLIITGNELKMPVSAEVLKFLKG